MNISRKFIRNLFKDSKIQMNEEALTMIEERLKLFADAYVALCKHKEYKRVTGEKMERLFEYEDSL